MAHPPDDFRAQVAYWKAHAAALEQTGVRLAADLEAAQEALKTADRRALVAEGHAREVELTCRELHKQLGQVRKQVVSLQTSRGLIGSKLRETEADLKSARPELALYEEAERERRRGAGRVLPLKGRARCEQRCVEPGCFVIHMNVRKLVREVVEGLLDVEWTDDSGEHRDLIPAEEAIVN